MAQRVRDYPDMLAGQEPNASDETVATWSSAVVVDADRTMVRALLFDLVDGVPRFIGVGASPSTALGPYADPAIGLQQAIRALEQDAGRRLFDGDQPLTPQQIGGDGVDRYFVTGLPAPPIQAALIPVGRSTLARQLAAAARRATTALADAAEDGVLDVDRFSQAALQTWLRLVQPTVVVLVFEQGSAEDWQVVLDALADVVRDGAITYGVVVADEPRQQAAATMLGAQVELSGIDPADYDPREIGAALEEDLRERYHQRVETESGMPALASASFVDRVRASQSVAAFLHRRMGRNVAVVAGGEGTVLQIVTGQATATLLRAEQDLSLGVRGLLRLPAERVMRWLPFRSSTEELTQWVLNRALRPFTHPEGRTDRATMAAFGRELIAALVGQAGFGEAGEIDLIAAGRPFVTDDPALTLLTLLDGFAPRPADGVVVIAIDAEGLLAPLGTLAADDPVFASDVLDQDFLTPLATCVVLSGQATDGALAARGEITYADGTSRRFSVPYGTLVRLPLAEGQSASLTLEPEPGIAVGARDAGEAVSFTDEQAVFGGELGVVIDGRGRPIALPEELEQRVARLKTWIVDLGGQVD